MKKGIYLGGKVYQRELSLPFLTGGNFETGFSKVESPVKTEVFDILYTNDWWPQSNQEVEFEIINGKASIKGLGQKNQLML